MGVARALSSANPPAFDETVRAKPDASGVPNVESIRAIGITDERCYADWRRNLITRTRPSVTKAHGFFGAAVPCNADGHMREHFPELHQYRVVPLGNSLVLIKSMWVKIPLVGPIS